jgi:hypothetical protein
MPASVVFSKYPDYRAKLSPQDLMFIYELTLNTPLITWEIGQVACKENPFVNFVVEETCRLFADVVCLRSAVFIRFYSSLFVISFVLS